MDKNNYVVKANKLIESKGRLGILEQKLFAILVSKIHTSDEDFKAYELEIADISGLLGVSSNTMYKRLKLAADELMDKRIEIESINENGKKEFIKTRLISSAQYVEGSGTLTLNFDPILKPYLLAIKGKETPFTKYMVKNILTLNTSYSIRLYEILKQREKMKSRLIELDELKEMLGIEGTSYDLFSAFERRIMKPSIVEINKFTDINITYKKKKTGRKISHIDFNIETKFGCFDIEEAELKEYEDLGIFDFEQIRVNAGLEKETLSRKQINTIYEKAVKKADRFNVDPCIYIKKNYEYAKERAKGGLYSYLIKAIESDYANAIMELGEIN